MTPEQIEERLRRLEEAVAEIERRLGPEDRLAAGFARFMGRQRGEGQDVEKRA